MALDAELLGLKSAGTYRFERDLSTISNDTTTISNLRLVVGFSKMGPFNTPQLITSSSDFIKIYGNIDRSLEKRGSYFHRSALVALTAGPILCLNLLNLDPDKDNVQIKSFSVNPKDVNKYITTLPLTSIYNTDKFWYPSDESFADAINTYLSAINTNKEETCYTNGIISFTNISKKPISILVKKASTFNTKGFELTLNEWYGEENVPEYLNGDSFVSDYMVEVYVVGGDFGAELKLDENYSSIDIDEDGIPEKVTCYKPTDTPYKRFDADIIYQNYFDIINGGFRRKAINPDSSIMDSNLNKFLKLPSVNLIGKYVGSLIPNFVDKLGKNIWIQKLINDDVNTVGLLCTENVSLIEDVDTTGEYINEKIDLIGHNIYDIITNFKSYIDKQKDDNVTDISPLSVNYLSYKCELKESDVYQAIEVELNLLKVAEKILEKHDEEIDYDSSDEYDMTTAKVKFIRDEDKDKYFEKSLHPYAWTSDEYDITIYTDSSYFDPENKSEKYAYDYSDKNDTNFKHIIINVEGEKPLMTTIQEVEYSENGESVIYKSKSKDDNNIIKIQENESVVDENAEITQGDYIVSHWEYNNNNTLVEEDNKETFSRLTRVVRTSYVYKFMGYKTDESTGNKVEQFKRCKKVICSGKIWNSGRNISNNLKSSQTESTFGTIQKITPIDKYCNTLQWYCLEGFKMRADSMPNGQNDRQNEILDMIRETPNYPSTVSNLFKTLIDRDYIQWRYLIDTFGLGLEEECKNVYTQLCQARKSALAIINCPSQLDFKKSIDPSFVNKSGGVEVEYIANGGDLSKNPLYLFTLPTIENGASWGAYYYPYLRISDLSAIKSVPPAAYVSNLYIQKYSRANAWSIVAGQKRGVISGNQVIGVEATLINENRDWLEPAGINSIIWENGVGVEIYANKTAKQSPKSALSSIHVRECCIFIQDTVESILRRYVFEYNTAQTRLEIKTLVDDFLETVKSNSGIYEYKTVMDNTNNTQEVIDNNMGIIDIYIEPVRGLEILAQRLTVMKTGGIAASSFD